MEWLSAPLWFGIVGWQWVAGIGAGLVFGGIWLWRQFRSPQG